MFIFLLGILLGFGGCLMYLEALMRKKNKDVDVKGESVYLNFFMIDKDEAVKAGVESKLEAKLGKGFIRDKIVKQIGKAAVSKVSDESVGTKIADKMAEEMPLRMAEMGMTASASKVYVRGSFFVVELRLLAVDMSKLVERAAGEEKANKLDGIFNLLGGQWAKDSMGSKIIPLICNKLEEKLPVVMRDKFSEKGIVMDVTVKSSKNQSAFFFEMVNAGEATSL